MKPLRIFCDFHHGEMAAGIQRLFAERLGHDVAFPSESFCRWACETYPQRDGGKVWTLRSQEPDTWCGCEIAGSKGLPRLVSRTDFLEADWDIAIVSRTESQPIMRGLLSHHRNASRIRVLAVNGVEGAGFDWGWVKHMLTSDLSTADLAPGYVKRLHYCQEIGRHFMDRPFVPITPDALKRVHCYMNFLSQYTEPYGIETARLARQRWCPTCGCPAVEVEAATPPSSSPWALYKAVSAHAHNVNRTGAFALHSYGRKCQKGWVEPPDLPAVYDQSALTWHYKHREAYGFSLLQSIARGRLAMVQEGFYKYRTAGRFLINGLTCLETPWDAGTIVDRIRWYTDNAGRANEYAYACYQAARGLMNWQHEAYRVAEFLAEMMAEPVEPVCSEVMQ